MRKEDLPDGGSAEILGRSGQGGLGGGSMKMEKRIVRLMLFIDAPPRGFSRWARHGRPARPAPAPCSSLLAASGAEMNQE